ncbi:BppU family phage baseplate upper protein [Staphylococcus saprophyticus]|uniref:BppU family phage baseplate upper protein n=1 Tax=Staphylococcus saprophyticus TaxID=29385 RepID=UPI0022EB9A0A|nr:BppU family phage baseplate upper protein [Staphylococcus saprophyticus]
MIYKNKDIETNINNKTVDIGNVGVRFYTEDENTGSIRIYIKWNGQPVNLDTVNMRPKLDLFLSDGSIFIDETINIVTPKSGLIQYNIPNKVIKHAGIVNAKLFLVSDNEKIHAANFSFNIVDSGVEGKVQKEISVNLVEDTVRRIMSDDLTVLLDSGFKTELTTDLQNYISENSEQFKGPQGERGMPGKDGVNGVEGKQGIRGEPGEKGEPFKYTDFTTEQLNNLKGPKGDPFKYTDFTQSQLDALKGPKGDNGVLVSDSGWIELPLLNGVTADTYNNSIKPSYKVIKIGGITIVRLVGMITNLSNNVTFSQIPKEYAIQLKTFYSVAFDRNTNEKLTFTISFNGDLKGQGSITTTKTFILDTMWVA